MFSIFRMLSSAVLNCPLVLVIYLFRMEIPIVITWSLNAETIDKTSPDTDGMQSQAFLMT